MANILMCASIGAVVFDPHPVSTLKTAAVFGWYIGMTIALLCIIVPAIAATLERD